MKAHEMIAKVRDLPPVSPAALQLVSLLGDPEAGNEESVRVLRQDPILTAKLLRACNSPTLGLDEPVASIDQAVLLLGNKQVYRMVVAMSLRPSLDLPLPAYALEAGDLWRHSLLAATAAEMAVIDGLQLGVDSSTAFTVGLLHDIGKSLTSRFLTRQVLISLQQRVTEGLSVIEAEKDVLGTDHGEVGAALAYVWRLPEPIVEAIGLHHTPPLKPAARLSALAFFANRVAHHAEALQSQAELAPSPVEARVFEALEFANDRLPSLIEQVVGASVETEDLVTVSC